MLIVLCYKYLIMHVHIVQSDFHVRHIPFRGITARTPPFPISWSPLPLVVDYGEVNKKIQNHSRGYS